MEEIQEISEISLFNKIKEYSERKGYDVALFKIKNQKVKRMNENFEIETDYKDTHYIQLFKNGEMKLSIYYDKFNSRKNSFYYSYYELYDLSDTERFLALEESENSLFDKVKIILNN